MKIESKDVQKLLVEAETPTPWAIAENATGGTSFVLGPARPDALPIVCSVPKNRPGDLRLLEAAPALAQALMHERVAMTQVRIATEELASVLGDEIHDPDDPHHVVSAATRVIRNAKVPRAPQPERALRERLCLSITGWEKDADEASRARTAGTNAMRDTELATRANVLNGVVTTLRTILELP